MTAAIARRLRLAAARILNTTAVFVRPPSPCRVRDWPDHPLCNGDACPACGTWDRPTGRFPR